MTSTGSGRSNSVLRVKAGAALTLTTAAAYVPMFSGGCDMRHISPVTVRVLSWLVCAVITAFGQSQPLSPSAQPTGKKPQETIVRPLTRVSTVEAPSEIASNFGPELRCDRDANLYLLSESFGQWSLRKISSKGERVATFSPDVDSHLKVHSLLSFALGRGDVYALANAQEITRYLLVYDADGKYKSTVKLAPGFAWQPSVLAVFQSGELLITGFRYVRSSDDQILHVPFTGLFKPDGTLIKELLLEDDDSLQQRAIAGDRQLTSPQAPGQNRAISFSQMDAGDDGNVYLMRWTSPAIFYVVAPSGEVVRRFTIDPGDANMHPLAMHLAGNRVAVLFMAPQTGNRVMKVTDLEGNVTATYAPKSAGEDYVGAAFACYTIDPERFTFLGSTKDDRLELIVAASR